MQMLLVCLLWTFPNGLINAVWILKQSKQLSGAYIVGSENQAGSKLFIVSFFFFFVPTRKCFLQFLLVFFYYEK